MCLLYCALKSNFDLFKNTIENVNNLNGKVKSVIQRFISNENGTIIEQYNKLGKYIEEIIDEHEMDPDLAYEHDFLYPTYCRFCKIYKSTVLPFLA